MTISDFMMPFIKVIEFSRTHELTFDSISFTFFDMWLYTTVAGIVIIFIKSHIDE